jgi:hypothetical protein
MTGTKIVVIVLVLIVVLFIVLAVWGSSTNASAPKTNEDNFNPGQYPILGAFNGVLAPFAPKLDLAKKTFDLTSTNPATPIRVAVPKDDSHKFRNAKFHLTPASARGCARIEYKAPDGDGDKLNDQKWPRSGDNLTQVSFTILQSGGTLTFTRDASPPQPCVVELQ